MARSASAPLADLAALAGGAALVTAFAPFGVAAAAFLSPALLFALWLRDTPRQALRHGLLYGAGLFGFGVSWIHSSLTYFADLHEGAAVALTALFVALLAAFPAGLGYLFARLAARASATAVLLFLPAAWTLLEWLRSRLFTGFPWLNLGYSQTDTALAGWAPVAGVPGVGLLVVLVAAALALLAVRRRRQDAARALLLGLLVWGGGLLLSGIDWTRPQGGAIEVALLQGNVAPEHKWRAERRLDTEDLYMEMIESQLGRDLILLPETALPELASEAASLLEAIRQEALEAGSAVLVGIPVDDEQTGHIHNGLIALGAASGSYYKRHLVPFGEYLPTTPALAWLGRHLDTDWSDFSPGPRRQPPIRAAGVLVGATICYEDAFPAQAARAFPDAELLVNASNDAWFGRSMAPEQHLQISRMLALALGKPLLRAANTGVSAIIGADGRLQASAGRFRKAVLEGRVTPRSGQTPYGRLGEGPVLAIAALSLLLAGLRRRPHPP